MLKKLKEEHLPFSFTLIVLYSKGIYHCVLGHLNDVLQINFMRKLFGSYSQCFKKGMDSYCILAPMMCQVRIVRCLGSREAIFKPGLCIYSFFVLPLCLFLNCRYFGCVNQSVNSIIYAMNSVQIKHINCLKISRPRENLANCSLQGIKNYITILGFVMVGVVFSCVLLVVGGFECSICDF